MFPQQQLSWLTWRRKLDDPNQTGIVTVTAMVTQLTVSHKTTIAEISRPISPHLCGKWLLRTMFLSPDRVVRMLDPQQAIVS